MSDENNKEQLTLFEEEEETQKLSTTGETKELISSENLNQMMDELKEEAKEQPLPEKQELADIPAKEEVKRLKLFFVCDMDEEAAYLHKMSVSGLHFIRKNGIQYIFEKGEPKEYFYHLGYYEKDIRNSEHYVAMYKEAGWDIIYHEKGEFNGVWNYFRTEAEDNAQIQIFGDRLSRISLYKRLLTSWRSLITTIAVCFVFILGLFAFLLFCVNASSITTIVLRVSLVVLLLILASLVLYLRLYIKIGKKLEELLKR